MLGWFLLEYIVVSVEKWSAPFSFNCLNLGYDPEDDDDDHHHHFIVTMTSIIYCNFGTIEC